MKLLTYQYQNVTGIGRLIDQTIYPITQYATMIDLLEAGGAGLAAAEVALNGQGIPEAEISYLPPVVGARKVIALGRNYAAHAAEGGVAPPKFPMLFHKTHTALNGHNRPIIIPPNTQRVDYEAELAVIIGKCCKNVAEADALDCVAGYAAANDVTARDWQKRTSQFTSGKMVDGFGPLGPWLVTKDALPDPQNLAIRLWHNGKLMQDGHTSNMIFSVAFTIAYISKITTLEVGDVIFTGTPEGVGFARKPPVYMQVGDRLTVEIEQIGQLCNYFV